MITQDFSGNYFELFGIAPGFDIDLDELAAQFRNVQQAVHPDRFVQASDQEKRLSMQRTTLVNEAYQVLKDPLTRARYLLTLQGFEQNEDTTTISDPAFLMEQMELRETIEDVRDSSDPLAAIGSVLDDVGGRLREMTATLAEQLSDLSADLGDANTTINKMQFLNKLRMEAEEIEIQLEDAL